MIYQFSDTTIENIIAAAESEPNKPWNASWVRDLAKEVQRHREEKRERVPDTQMGLLDFFRGGPGIDANGSPIDRLRRC